jgi:hypothetical protein
MSARSLQSLRKELKISCFVVAIASLPPNDDEVFECATSTVLRPIVDGKSVVKGWSNHVIRKFLSYLSIDEQYLFAYEPLIRKNHSLLPETRQMILPFIDNLVAEDNAVLFLVELYLFLVTAGNYDARGRVMTRNAVDILGLSREEHFAIEISLADMLHDFEERLASSVASDEPSTENKVLYILF